MVNGIRSLDWNMAVDEKFPDENVVHSWCREWFKSYVFQKEQGETGFIHWQGRGSLIKKTLHSTVKGLLGVHNTPTSGRAAGAFSYVMKAQTRVDGPWSDKDYEEPPVLTRQLKYFLQQTPYPWQTQLLQYIQQPDDRKIILLYDTIGNNGKSIFAEYLEYNKLAYEIPPMRSMEDIMQCAMSIKTQTCYLVDMPRGMKKSKLSDFYAGLEALKNGVMYDKRYAFRKRRIDRPHIVVFTNHLPLWNLMSLDRWEVHEFTDQKSLKPVEIAFGGPKRCRGQ